MPRKGFFPFQINLYLNALFKKEFKKLCKDTTKKRNKPKYLCNKIKTCKKQFWIVKENPNITYNYLHSAYD